MTTAQTIVYDNQQKPENKYVFHPAVDGCVPRHPPAIRDVQPQSIQRSDGDHDVLVLGSGFAVGASIAVSGPDVAVANVVHKSDLELVVTLALKHDTLPGPRTVLVTNPNGDSASCAGCLEITDTPILH